jgi:hypothetical protein
MMNTPPKMRSGALYQKWSIKVGSALLMAQDV